MSSEATWQSPVPPYSLGRAIFYSVMLHLCALLVLFLSDFLPVSRPKHKVISFGSGLTVSAGLAAQAKKPAEPLGVARKLEPLNPTIPAPPKLTPLPTPATPPKPDAKRIIKPLPTPKSEIKKAEQVKMAEALPTPRSRTKRAETTKRILATPPPKSASGQDAARNASRNTREFSSLPSLSSSNGPLVQRKGSPDGGGLPSVGMQTEAGITLPQDYLLDSFQKIQGNFRYPGNVDKRLVTTVFCIVEFRVMLDGRITDIKVIQSTGDPILDGYATRTLEKTMSLRALGDYIKKDMGRNYITATVPFAFGGGAK